MAGPAPPTTPVTMPEELPTVAEVVGLLVQVPPVGVLPISMVAPSHTTLVPVMAVGTGLTVTVAEPVMDCEHDPSVALVSVYVLTVAVVPVVSVPVAMVAVPAAFSTTLAAPDGPV